MEHKVLKYIEKHNMLHEGDKVLVGVSGGADSMCLLLVLLKLRDKLKIKLHAVHVNHCLRGEAAEADARFVEEICERWQIECTTKVVDVKGMVKEKKLSTEEAARILRYQAFDETAKVQSCNKIAVAHHGDDQAETVLFQMFRGSGLRGVSGMLPVRDNIIRPLLCVDKRDIEAFLKKNNVGFCTDVTNFSDDYTRNKIRLKVIPYIKENINERIAEHLNSLAEDAAKTDEFLRREARKVFDENALIDNGVLKLNLKALKSEEILVSYVLRICIEEIKTSLKDIGRKHIEDIYHLAALEGNKEIMLPYGLRVKKEYDELIFAVDRKNDVKKMPPKNEISFTKEEIKEQKEGIIIKIGDTNVHMSVRKNKKNQKYAKKIYTKCFDYDTIGNVLSLRTRKPGDFLVINKTGGRKKLKDYFIDEKIPKQKRDELIVLANDSHILWVFGYRMSEDCKITDNTEYILEIEINGG